MSTAVILLVAGPCAILLGLFDRWLKQEEPYERASSAAQAIRDLWWFHILAGVVFLVGGVVQLLT